MPRIPLLKEQAPHQVAPQRNVGQADLAAARAIESVGGAASAALRDVDRFKQQLQASRDNTDLSAALAYSAHERTTNFEEIKQGDYNQAEGSFKNKEKDIAAEVKKNWPRIADAWQQKDLRHQDTTTVKLNAWRTKQDISHQQAQLEVVEQTWKDEAIKASDDVSMGVASANYFEAIDKHVATGGITEKDAAKRKITFAKDVMSTRIDNDIIANPIGTLSKLESREYAVDEETRTKKIEKAKVQIRVQDAKATATGKNELATIRKEAKAVLTELEAGADLSPDAIKLVQAKALILPEEEQASFNREVNFFQAAKPLFMVSETQAQAELAALGKPQSAEESRLRRKLEVQINQHFSDLKKDPLEVYDRKVAPVPALDIQAPESWQQRIDTANKASAQYATPLTYLKDEEAADIGTQLDKMNAQDQLSVIGVITDSAGDEAAPAIFDQIAHKSGSSIAEAGYLASQGKRLPASWIIQGSEARKGGMKIDPDVTAKLREFAAPYRFSAEKYNNVVKSLVDGYAGNSFLAGDINGTFDDDRIEAVGKAIVAGADYNGSAILLPNKLTEEEFQAWADNIDPAYIDQLGGVKSEDSERIVKNIRSGDLQLLSIGEGEYLLQVEGQAQYMLGNDGRPFILEYDPHGAKQYEQDQVGL